MKMDVLLIGLMINLLLLYLSHHTVYAKAAPTKHNQAVKAQPSR